MKQLKNVWKYICRIRGLKYALVTVVAFVLIGFVDENSVWHYVQNQQRISQLQEEIDENLAIHQHNKRQLQELESNPGSIRKIARERYFMKADDEDIFVLSDDTKQKPSYETVE